VRDGGRRDVDSTSAERQLADITAREYPAYGGLGGAGRFGYPANLCAGPREWTATHDRFAIRGSSLDHGPGEHFKAYRPLLVDPPAVLCEVDLNGDRELDLIAGSSTCGAVRVFIDDDQTAHLDVPDATAIDGLRMDSKEAKLIVQTRDGPVYECQHLGDGAFGEAQLHSGVLRTPVPASTGARSGKRWVAPGLPAPNLPLYRNVEVRPVQRGAADIGFRCVLDADDARLRKRDGVLEPW